MNDRPTESGGLGQAHKAFVKAARDAAESVSNSIERFHGPIWTAQGELLKSLLSLASAALVLTVTFSGNLLSRALPATWPQGLLLSWGLFSCSVVFAVLGLNQLVGLRSFGARLHSNSETLWNIMKDNLQNQQEPFEDIYRKLVSIAGEIKSYERRLRWCVLIGLLLFILALILLCAFGWSQLMLF